MEETKQPKTAANGLILAILLIMTIIIALMWVMVYKLNDDKDELQSQVNSAKSEAETLKRQVVMLQARLGEDEENEVDNKVNNDIENDEEDDTDNTVDNTTTDEEDDTELLN